MKKIKNICFLHSHPHPTIARNWYKFLWLQQYANNNQNNFFSPHLLPSYFSCSCSVELQKCNFLSAAHIDTCRIERGWGGINAFVVICIQLFFRYYNFFHCWCCCCSFSCASHPRKYPMLWKGRTKLSVHKCNNNHHVNECAMLLLFMYTCSKDNNGNVESLFVHELRASEVQLKSFWDVIWLSARLSSLWTWMTTLLTIVCKNQNP